ncbi:uncharacterized protein TNCV_4514301 [Trichonephila clavipes]|nr:uncharacterized protein TNCV_4514301 [Trichonephila clavipes]
MAAVDFLHHENPSTWAGVKPATLGTEGQGQTEQFHRDASLEVVDERAAKNSKTGSGRKVTSARDDRHLLRMAVNGCTVSSRQLAALWPTTTGVLVLTSSPSAAPWIACKGAFIQDPPHGKPLTAASAMGSMSTEPGKLIGIKLSFQMNHASICGTMMVTFVLDAMPVNAAFQSALSNDIVA